MKQTFLILASGILLLSSCSGDASGDATGEENKAENSSVAYTVDVEASTLKWIGGEVGDEHVGFLKFKSGSVNIKGTEVEKGSLVVDMNSVSLENPGDGSERLIGHLKSPDFFNTESFPTVEVEISSLKNGKLSTTVNFLGVKMTQEVAVTVASTENGATMKGNFSFDFAESKMPYITPDESGEIGAPSIIQFELDLKLKK